MFNYEQNVLKQFEKYFFIWVPKKKVQNTKMRFKKMCQPKIDKISA